MNIVDIDTLESVDFERCTKEYLLGVKLKVFMELQQLAWQNEARVSERYRRLSKIYGRISATLDVYHAT